MAAPQIRFKRGAQSNLPALAAGEALLLMMNIIYILVLMAHLATISFRASARYWVKETGTTGHAVKLYSRTDGSGGGSVKSCST